MAWRNVISKNANATEARATKLVEKKPLFTSIACCWMGENDKCKLIAWFVLLFDSKNDELSSYKVSAAVTVFGCIKIFRCLFSHFNFIFARLKSCMWTTCGLSSAVAFFVSLRFPIAAVASSSPPPSGSGKNGLSKQSRLHPNLIISQSSWVFSSRTSFWWNILYDRRSSLCDKIKRMNKIIRSED